MTEPPAPPEPPDDFPALRIDPDTLQEVFDDPEAAAEHVEVLRQRIRDAPDEIAELLSRTELIELLRALGRLDEALDEANAAVDRAEIAGTAAQVHLARVRLANVHRQRGEYSDSNVLFTELLAAADQFGPVVEAFTHQGAGQNDFDQQHWDDAIARFAHALRIREELELDDADASRLALAAARRRVET